MNRNAEREIDRERFDDGPMYEDDDGLHECGFCEGAGEIVYVMPPLEKSDRCPACKGRGEITDEDARRFEREEAEMRLGR